MKTKVFAYWAGPGLLLGFFLQTDAAMLPPESPPVDAPRYVSDRMIIRFKETPEVSAFKQDDRTGLEQLVQALNLPPGTWLEPGMEANEAQATAAANIDWMLLHLPGGLSVEEAITQLKDHPLIDYVEPDTLGFRSAVVPNDPFLYLQPNLLNRHFKSSAGRADVHAPEAWALNQGSNGVVVAILDSGINASLPDFAGRLIPGRNTLTSAGSEDTTDDDSHGTEVASAGFATGNDSNSVAGIDWNCKIMPVKLGNWQGSSASAAARAFNWATANGAKIISISWYFGADVTLRNAINFALSNGVVVVNAFGNSSKLATLEYLPNSVDGVIHVGGSSPTDMRAAFSTYSPRIDLIAPASVYAHNRQGPLGIVWGTSFAAPQTAAAIALLASQRPGITPEEATALICASADDLVGDATDEPGFDIYHGWGRLNVARALRLLELGAGGMTNIADIRAQYSPDVPEMDPGPVPQPEMFPLPSRWESPDGHWAPVVALAASSDNETLASGGSDGRVLLWNMTSGSLAATAHQGSVYVMDVEISPDGHTLAIALADGNVILKDIQGQPFELLTLDAHDARVTSIVFSPEGDRLVTGGNDGLVKIWDATNGILLQTLTGHTGAITGLAITWDGSRIISGSADMTTRRWMLGDGASDGLLAQFPSGVRAVTASPVGNEVAVAYGSAGQIVVLDADTLSTVGSIDALEQVEALEFLPDGSAVVSGDARGLIRVWPIPSGSPVGIISSINSILSVALTPDGTKLIEAGLDQVIRVYEMPSRTLLHKLGGVVCKAPVSLTGDGSRMASRSRRGFFESDAVSGALSWEQGIDNQAQATAVAYHPTNPVVATATAWNGDIAIRNAASGSVIVARPNHLNWVTAMAFTPDGNYLISSDADGAVIIWDGTSPFGGVKMISRGRYLFGGPFDVLPIAPDSSSFLQATVASELQAWSVPGGVLLQTYPGHEAEAMSAAYSPDGSVIGSTYSDGTIRLYDFVDATLLWEKNDWRGPLNSVAFSVDGQYLVAGGSYITHPGVGVWRVADGSFIGRFTAETGDPHGVDSVGFLPDAKDLILGYGSGHVVRVRADIPPIRFTEIAGASGQIRLEWEGSYPRYEVQTRSLADGSIWAPVGSPGTNTSLVVPNGGNSALFRLEGLDP